MSKLADSTTIIMTGEKVFIMGYAHYGNNAIYVLNMEVNIYNYMRHAYKQVRGITAYKTRFGPRQGCDSCCPCV